MSERAEIELTVVLPTHNGSSLIEHQLRALSEQRWDGQWEIVLLNNGSTDDTRSVMGPWIDRMPVPTRIVDADEHLSLAYARNAGVDAARGESVAFCDDDDIVCPGWVAALGTALRSHPFVASSFEYASLNDPITAAVRGSFQTEELGLVMGVPVASGGGSGCRRDLWNQVGGNSLDFYHSGEDIDFSLRLYEQTGVVPFLASDAIYHVRLRGGARTAFSQAIRFARASVLLYRVHGPALGAVREPTVRTLRRWLGLVARSPGVLERKRRLKWIWQVGYRIGRIRGSIDERVWYP